MTRDRVLLIDDERDFCFFVRANLEARGGLKVETAHSGEEGLELAVRFKPHLILLDIIMPEMDGLQVLAELKRDSRTMFIPVLMLSARHDDQSKVEAAGLYCEGYLTKPIAVDDLVAAIRKILDRRRLR